MLVLLVPMAQLGKLDMAYLDQRLPFIYFFFLMHIDFYAYLSITCYINQGERGHPGLPGPFGPKGEGLPGPTVRFTKIYFCCFSDLCLHSGI